MIEVALNVLVLLSVIALLPAFISSIAADSRVFSYIKQFHPQEFERLGRPTIWSGKLSASSPAVRYISRREYQNLHDSELSRLGNIARSRQFIAVAVLLVVILSILIDSALYK
jgi:hypothetical protein